MASQTTVPAGTARTQTNQVTPSTGPFAISWPFCNLDDVVVTVETDGVVTTQTRGVDYNITATANDDGIYPSGTITFLSPVSGVITRARTTTIERSSNFPLTGFLDRASLNADLNRGMMALQDNQATLERSVRTQAADSVTLDELPLASDRANKALMFDADGQVTVEALVGGWRSTWATATAYYANDIIEDGAAGGDTHNVYICTAAHTSGTFATDLAAGKWVLCIDAQGIAALIDPSIIAASDVATATPLYPLFASAVSGVLTSVYTSDTKLNYTPSTGTLAATVLSGTSVTGTSVSGTNLTSSGGIVTNTQTISANRTIASGYSGMSAGPITIASGVSVTVSSGSRWVVL